MIRQNIVGFRRAVIPGMVIVFCFLLVLSVCEAIYRTPYGTALVYLAVCLAFVAVAGLIVLGIVGSCEYILTQDVLVVIQQVSGNERQRHVIRLGNADVQLYKGIRRLLGLGAGGKLHLCYIPFFGGVRRVSIVYQDGQGRRHKVVIKPSAEMLQAVERALDTAQRQ